MSLMSSTVSVFQLEKQLRESLQCERPTSPSYTDNGALMALGALQGSRFLQQDPMQIIHHDKTAVVLVMAALRDITGHSIEYSEIKINERTHFAIDLSQCADSPYLAQLTRDGTRAPWPILAPSSENSARYLRSFITFSAQYDEQGLVFPFQSGDPLFRDATLLMNSLSLELDYSESTGEVRILNGLNLHRMFLLGIVPFSRFGRQAMAELVGRRTNREIGTNDSRTAELPEHCPPFDLMCRLHRELRLAPELCWRLVERSSRDFLLQHINSTVASETSEETPVEEEPRIGPSLEEIYTLSVTSPNDERLRGRIKKDAVRLMERTAKTLNKELDLTLMTTVPYAMRGLIAASYYWQEDSGISFRDYAVATMRTAIIGMACQDPYRP